jgi:hypothetical protein
MIKDGLTFSDENSTDFVVFNYYTFREIIVGILIKYAKKSESDARLAVEQFKYFVKPITTYNDVIFFSHETEYHWAMLIEQGDNYWLKGIPTEPPIDYDEWETDFILQNNLSDFTFEFSD